MLCDMFLTTHFMTLIIVTVWRLPLLVAAAFYLFFAPIEGTYLSSAFEKIPTGALAASCLGSWCSNSSASPAALLSVSILWSM